MVSPGKYFYLDFHNALNYAFHLLKNEKEKIQKKKKTESITIGKIFTCPDFINITRIMAFSGVKSDGGNPSFGSNNVVIFKSIFIGDPGTKDGN